MTGHIQPTRRMLDEGRGSIFCKRAECVNQLPILQPTEAVRKATHTPGAVGWCQGWQLGLVLWQFGLCTLVGLAVPELRNSWYQLLFPTQWLPQWTDWPLVVPILSFYVISTLYIPFYRWGNWGIEKLGNLPGVMLGFRAQALCLQCHSLNHFNTLPHHIICTWNVFFYSPLDRKILKEH